MVRWKVIEILWLHFLRYWKHKTASCMGLKTAQTLGRRHQSPVFCCCYLLCIFNPSHSHSQSSHEHTGTEPTHPCDLTLSLCLGVPQNQSYRGETVKIQGTPSLQVLPQLPSCLGNPTQESNMSLLEITQVPSTPLFTQRKLPILCFLPPQSAAVPWLETTQKLLCTTWPSLALA